MACYHKGASYIPSGSIREILMIYSRRGYCSLLMLGWSSVAFLMMQHMCLDVVREFWCGEVHLVLCPAAPG